MTVTPYLTLGYLGLAKQSGQGSPSAPAKYPILRRQAFVPVQNFGEFRTGNQRDISIITKQDFLYAGAFQTYLYADEGASLLAWAMGADTKTGSSDPYTHTLALANGLPYLTAEASFYQDQIIDRVGDCKIAKLLIEGEARKEVMLTVNLMGGIPAVQGSASTPSFSNGAGEGPMMFYHGAFTLSGPGDASAMQAQVQKYSIEIDQDMSAEYGPGVIYPIALVEQARKVTFKMRVMFTGDDLHRLTNYGSSSGTGVSETVGDGSFEVVHTSVAASPGPERSAKFTCGYLKWKMAQPEFDPDGKTGFMDVESIGYRSGNNLPFTAVFKNGVSTAQV